MNKKRQTDLVAGEHINFQPVVKVNALRKVVMKALLVPFKQPLIDVNKPKQLGAGNKFGGS